MSLARAEVQTIGLKVTPESEAVIKSIGLVLKEQNAAVALTCQEGGCQLGIDQEREPELDVEAIGHPFRDELLVLRLHGGSQELQKTIYTALEKFSPTRDFKGTLDERSVALDDGGYKFRCVASREEAPKFECWLLFYAKTLIIEN